MKRHLWRKMCRCHEQLPPRHLWDPVSRWSVVPGRLWPVSASQNRVPPPPPDSPRVSAHTHTHTHTQLRSLTWDTGLCHERMKGKTSRRQVSGSPGPAPTLLLPNTRSSLPTEALASHNPLSLSVQIPRDLCHRKENQWWVQTNFSVGRNCVVTDLCGTRAPPPPGGKGKHR